MGYLVLGRTEGQTVIIGNVEVTITRVDRGHVRLAISAPPEINIVRKELLERNK